MPQLRFPEFWDAGEWEEIKLGDVCLHFKGFAFKSKDYMTSGKRVVRVSDMGFDYIKDETSAIYIKETKLYEKWKLLQGDLIITTVGSKPPVYNSLVGRTIVVKLKDEGSLLNQNAVCLRASQNIEQGFLNALFRREEYISFIESIIRGNANQGSIALVDLFKYIILKPKPKEQQKIANCLASLDELITAQTQKLDSLKAHKKGLMQQLFPATGETVPKLRFPEFRDAGEWEEQVLKDIATVKSGSTPLRSNSDFYQGGIIPWVKTTDLNNSFIFHTSECITPLANARINPEDSVIVAMYGGFNQIGRTGYLKVPAATNQALSVLNTDCQKIIPIYLLLWLNAKVENWKAIASSSRKDPNITGKDVATFQITYPKIKEQQKIANCLTSLDDVITAQIQKINTLKAHKKGLMQQLFPSTDETA